MNEQQSVWVPGGYPPEILVGERTVLRRWHPDDTDVMHGLISANVEHLRPWMPWIAQEPLVAADRRQLLVTWGESWASRHDFSYVILREGDAVGSAGLHCRQGPGILEVGYWVAEHHQGSGVATESAVLLASAALVLPGVNRVELHHDERNIASGRVAQKAGFRREGTYARAPEAPGDSGTAVRWVLERT